MSLSLDFLASCCSLLPVGVQDPPDFSHDLTGQASEVEVVQTQLPETVIEQIAALVERPAAELQPMRLYQGKYQRGQSPRQQVHFVHLPLPEPFVGGRLVLAVNGRGRCAGIGLWGTDAFDEDPYAGWGIFMTSLMNSGSPAQVVGEGSRVSELDAALGALHEKDHTALALSRLYLAMKTGSRSIQQFFRYVKEGEAMPAGWFDPAIEAYEALIQERKALAPWVGVANKEAFREDVEEVLVMLVEAQEALVEQDVEGARAVIEPRFDQGLCMRCHDLKAASGGKMRAALRRAYFQTELPKGVYVPGYDIPLAPALDPRTTAHLAQLYRACLQVVAATQQAR